MSLPSDALRATYQPMINLLTASRAEQIAVYVQIQLMIRQAMDDEEAGRAPVVSSGDIIREYETTLRMLIADRATQMDMVGGMELEIRQQRDADVAAAVGYAKPPILPGQSTVNAVADARSRLNQESPVWASESALPTPEQEKIEPATEDPVSLAVRRRAA